MKIGYIGLGALGTELARRFLPAHDLVVWDLNPAAVDSFQALGARVAQSPIEVGQQCDTVLLCLPRSADVQEVLFGSGGLAGSLSPGKLVIDQTSGAARETAAFARELEALGIGMMDAAVSASPHIVGQGGATLMASAPDAVYLRGLPVLSAITETVYRCGARVGDGQALKTVNNAMNAGCRMGTLELTALGRKAGLSLEAMTEVFNRGEARNQTTEKMLPAIAEGRASTNFGLSLMLKDVNQAVALGMDLGVPMPTTDVTRGILQMGANLLGERAKLEDMVGLVESMAGTRFRALAAQGGPSPAAASSTDEAGRIETIDHAIGALCRVITCECVAAGSKYGLDLEVMATVLNKSSGWSAASQRVLPSLSHRAATPDRSIGSVVCVLRETSRLAHKVGAPIALASAARALYELGASMHGETSDIHCMAKVFEGMAGIEFN